MQGAGYQVVILWSANLVCREYSEGLKMAQSKHGIQELMGRANNRS